MACKGNRLRVGFKLKWLGCQAYFLGNSLAYFSRYETFKMGFSRHYEDFSISFISLMNAKIRTGGGLVKFLFLFLHQKNYKHTMIRNFSIFLLFIVFGLGIGSCSKDEESTPDKTLMVKPGSLSLVTGGTAPLSAVWVDKSGNETAILSVVEWSSSAPSIATATPIGIVSGILITGVLPGNAVITAKIEGKTATCPVSVTGLDVTGKVLLIGISSVSINEGEEYGVSAFFVNQDGIKSAAAPVWSITNSSLATISNDGKVKGLAEGASFIHATVTEGSKTFSASIPLVIKKAPAKTGGGVDPSPLTGFVAAPAAILWADANPTDNLQIEWVYFGSGTLSAPTFATSNSAVVSVSTTGKVTFNGVGEAVITVSASAGSSNYTQKIPVVVVGMPTVALPVFRVEVTPGFSKAFMEKTVQFSAKALKANGDEVTGRPILWEIEDTEPDTLDNGQLEFAASVNNSGLVTTKSPRQVKVKATVDGITGTADLWIYPDGFYTATPLIFNMTTLGSQLITANYFEFDANFQVQAKPFPTTTNWFVLNDLMFGFWPIKGQLSGSGNSRTYTIDPSSLAPGSDFIFVMHPTNEKIMPAISSAIIN